MSSSKVSCFLSLLCFTFSLQTALGADPLGYSCLSQDTFTPGGPYEQNLIKLLGLISYEARSTGFGQAGFGQAGSGQTFGLGLCRGDVSSWACLGCITKAGAQAQKLCPQKTGAVIWYDECMVKYMDYAFFGQIDNSVFVSLWNVNNASEPIGPFIQKKNELLGQLVEKASKSPKMYASGLINVGVGREKIYGLAQCTRDLASDDCKKCLMREIDQLPKENQGGRILGGSCNVRYEIYPFVKRN